MILSTLITQVQEQTGFPRDMILTRAREAWPTSVDFRDVQVRLLVDAIQRERAGKRSISRTMQDTH